MHPNLPTYANRSALIRRRWAQIRPKESVQPCAISKLAFLHPAKTTPRTGAAYTCLASWGAWCRMHVGMHLRLARDGSQQVRTGARGVADTSGITQLFQVACMHIHAAYESVCAVSGCSASGKQATALRL
jgi:hypothetical protein